MVRVFFIRSTPVAPDPRVEKEASALGENGFEVEILAWDRTSSLDQWEDKESYKIRRFRYQASFGKPDLILKLIIWSFYELIYLFRHDYDVIHACDFDTLLPAVIASKIRGKFLVYDSFDFYSDHLPQSVPTIFRNFVAAIEIFLSGFANFVILADKSRNPQFKNKLKREIVINNSPKDINKKEIQKIKKNHKPHTDFIIFYAGIINKTRGLDKIIHAIKDLTDVRLIVAGYETEGENIIEKLKKTENVTFLGKLTYEQVIKETMKCDLLFALYDPVLPNHLYASPNKVFEAMMCGKPIIVSANTNMAEIVTEENCGLSVPYTNVQKIKKSIVNLKENLELYNKLSQNARIAYENKYSWVLMEKRLIDEYKLLTNDL